MKATYNITTNKIKFTPPPGRLDPEQDKKRRACGFVWYPGQKVFCAAWSPSAEDFIQSFGVDLESDDTPDDVESRVARFSGYADAAEKSAEGARDYANDATTEKRVERALNRAASEAERAEYWTRRIAASIAHAQRSDRPDVISRRIKGLEADLRKHTKENETAQSFLTLWCRSPMDRARALKLANYGGQGMQHEGMTRSVWSLLESEKITIEQAQQNAVEGWTRRLEYSGRWIAHLTMRIEYERAFLDSVGGDPVAKLAHVKKGDFVIWHEELCEVLRVNKVTLELKVNSRHWIKGGMKVDKTEITMPPVLGAVIA